LFHEKPFEHLNGSGKHNNWSLETDTGINLLKPGKTPMGNLQFLAFFINTIKAVNDYETLLRSSIASASNDLRLGHNESPPNIISVFIGEKLTKVLQQLEKVTKGKLSPEEKTDLKLNVIGKIPEILLDNTDRNRTAPFAFTGNKFEFRAVGSKSSCANPMTVLNSIVAKQLIDFKTEVDLLIDVSDLPKDDAIFNVLREYIKKCKPILYDGSSYSDTWEKEAKKRGLSHFKNTPEALKAVLEPKNIELFESLNVMTELEVRARLDIALQDYIKRVQIEGRVWEELVLNYVVPSAVSYQNDLLHNTKQLQDLFNEDYELMAKSQLELIKAIAKHIRIIKTELDIMVQARKKANGTKNLHHKATIYCNMVRTRFDDLRYHSDKLELLVDDASWSLVKYREMLI
jgi:glutamine synthetase